MADDLERWTEKTPERQVSERRYLFDREPTFGLAHDAELMRRGVPPPPRVATARKRRRERGPFVTYMRVPWSYGDRNAGDRWHKMRCRLGRHEIRGGHVMQLGSSMVFVERRCRWCGMEPG
jgi:hypothetical protein